MGLRNHVCLIKCPGVLSSRVPWIITSKSQSGYWAMRKVAGATVFNYPLMLPHDFPLAQQDTSGFGLQSGDLKIVWGCGKTLKLKLYIYLILLVCLPIWKPNYSKAWLKETSENISQAQSKTSYCASGILFI